MRRIHDTAEPVTPTRSEMEIAGRASERLERVVRADRPFRFSPERDGETVEVPGAAAALLVRLLREMAAGNTVTLIPIHAELTTKQAADLLGVSRPFLIKLIEEGKLPCRKVGKHRRVRFKDLMALKQRSDAERRRALEELAREAQDLGLGY